jgi:hypothetical protein
MAPTLLPSHPSACWTRRLAQRRLAQAIADKVTASRLTEYAEELEGKAAALEVAAHRQKSVRHHSANSVGRSEGNREQSARCWNGNLLVAMLLRRNSTKRLI